MEEGLTRPDSAQLRFDLIARRTEDCSWLWRGNYIRVMGYNFSSVSSLSEEFCHS